MKGTFSRLVLFCVLGFAGLASLMALPDWAEPLLSRTSPPTSANTKAVVLLDETDFDVRSDGSVKESHRFAVRILDKSAASLASVGAWCSEKDEKFSGAGAWLYRDGKRFRPDPVPEWTVRQPLDEDTAKSESVKHTISYAKHVLKGDFFFAEWTVTRTPLLRVVRHTWSSRGPIERKAIQYKLPPGWGLTVEAGTPEALKVEVAGSEGVWRWSQRREAPLADEEDAPSTDEIAAWLRVRIQPRQAPVGKWLDFDTWPDCGRWIEALNVSQTDTNPALKNRAEALVASSDGTKIGELQALAAFVQEIPYVSVESGLGLGLGFQARKATQVLARQLGDCKDKVNLFQALCKERGFKAFLVATQTEPIDFDKTWVGPSQFNHAIAAVAVDDSVDNVAVIKTERFGRVLLFDPTSETTNLGDLPWYLDGQPALIVGEGKTEVLRLPSAPDSERYVYRHHAELAITPSGGVRGKLVIDTEGPTAQWARRVARDSKSEDLRKRYTSRLSRSVKGVAVSSVNVVDGKATRSHRTEVQFGSESFAQAMPGGLMVLKLDVFGDSLVPAYPASTRVRNLKRDPSTVTETVKVVLPPGIKVEELPRDAHLEGEFGRYTSQWLEKGGVITLERKMNWKTMNIPPSRYGEFKTFLSKVAKANASSILIRVVQ